MKHRPNGFTLIEGVAAMVILAIAVPVSVIMTADAASVRGAAAQRERAVMLVDIVRTEIVADMASPSDGGGLTLLDNLSIYEDVLRARIEPLAAPYEEAGASWTIRAGAPVGPLGVGSLDADLNIYTPITIVVTWQDAREGTRTLEVTLYVSEIGA